MTAAQLLAKLTTMKERKTFEISKIKELANNYFNNSHDEDKEKRTTLYVFVSNILHQAGAYKGFGYLTKDMMLDKQHGFGIEYKDNDPVLRDSTRVFFY